MAYRHRHAREYGYQAVADLKVAVRGVRQAPRPRLLKTHSLWYHRLCTGNNSCFQ